MTPPVTVAQFRANFTAFASTTVYPSASVQFWLDLGAQMVNECRWGRQYSIGVQLFAAHNLILEAKAAKESASGGIGGQQVGPVSNKSVDKVSVGYDVNAGIVAGAGHWNLTVYGTRFKYLIGLFGAGPIQVGVGYVPPGTGPAWPGPYTMPSPTGFGN